MAILPAPPAPQEVQIEVRGLRGIVVRWAPAVGEGRSAVNGFRVRVQYFDAHGPMVEAFWETQEQAGGTAMAKEFPHPDSALSVAVAGLRACTVRVAVTATNEKHEEGDAARKQITWDSMANTIGAELKGQRGRLERACREYTGKRGRSSLKVLVIGGQHHGKSSFVNHMNRCFRGMSDIPDEMETAPAGQAENTFEIKSLWLPFDGFSFQFVDTPAFATLNAETGEALDALLANGIPDGTRRKHFTSKESLLRQPPDAAIVVLSLMHWVSLKTELKDYLKVLSAKFKNASQGRVAFPFAVAVTKRDDFLSATQDPRPHEALAQIVDEIRECANTEKVHVLTNMREGSFWSRETVEETFRLMSGVVTFAKNQNTRVVKDETLSLIVGACVVVVVWFVRLMVAVSK